MSSVCGSGFCWTHRPSEGAQAEGALLLYLLRLQRLQVQGVSAPPRPTTRTRPRPDPSAPPRPTPAPSLTATSQPSERGNFLSFGNTFHWLFSFPKGDPSRLRADGEGTNFHCFSSICPQGWVNFSLSHTWTPVQSHTLSLILKQSLTPLPPQPSSLGLVSSGLPCAQGQASSPFRALNRRAWSLPSCIHMS